MTKSDPMVHAKPPRSPLIWLMAGLAGLIALNVLKTPGFLNVTLLDGHLFGTPVDIFTQGSRTMLLALGMTLVIATGGVDLSVGSIVAIAGAACAILLRDGHGLTLTIASALGIGVAAGFANGVLVARLGIQPIVATLILMVAGRGVAQLVVDGQVVFISNKNFEFLANGFVLGLPVAPLLVAAAYLASHLFLRRTASGLFVEAVGDNETASRFAGLSAARVKALVYIFCGACAGLTGVLAAANIRAGDAYRLGENAELDAIFAVVVGGTALTGGRFSIVGSLLGALLIQTLTLTMYNLGVPPAVAPVPKALLIIGVSLLQSDKFHAWIKRIAPRRRASA
jgi:galactofuranose transport system permease protein